MAKETNISINSVQPQGRSVSPQGSGTGGVQGSVQPTGSGGSNTTSQGSSGPSGGNK